MPAVAKKPSTEARETREARTVRVVALEHAFYDLKRYRRGDELDITIPEGQKMPAWCIAEPDAPRGRDGKIDLNELPLFFPANARG